MVTGKCSVTIGTLIYILVHVNLILHFKVEMDIPLRPIPKGDILRRWLAINWASDGSWHTKLLDPWELTQVNLLRRESVKLSLFHPKSGTSRWSDDGWMVADVTEIILKGCHQVQRKPDDYFGSDFNAHIEVWTKVVASLPFVDKCRIVQFRALVTCALTQRTNR